LPELASDRSAKREAAERRAINCLVQATASDIFKTVLVNVSNSCEIYIYKNTQP
jgi:DNA polymerase I-like protein with 3'-5' exonuclease and polymerase domains